MRKKKVIKKTQVIGTVELHDDIDEAAEELSVSVIEFRYICKIFNIDVDNIYKENCVYFFTFGTQHFTTDGMPMADYYVKVSAKDAGIARELFIEHFTKPFMPAPNKFAFQYKDSEVDVRYFKNGELLEIVDTGNSILIQSNQQNNG